jgi:catechol 2,3-dioxygenase-like lactoylglutathione lyase family enzyme
MRVGHVNFSIDDVERARSFYEDVMGLAPAPRPAEAGRAGLWFDLGAAELHLSVEENPRNAESKRHVAFELDAGEDLDGLRARFQAAGVPIEEGRQMTGMRRFFVRDPAGNRLELYRREG